MFQAALMSQQLRVSGSMRGKHLHREHMDTLHVASFTKTQMQYHKY